MTTNNNSSTWTAELLEAVDELQELEAEIEKIEGEQDDAEVSLTAVTNAAGALEVELANAAAHRADAATAVVDIREKIEGIIESQSKPAGTQTWTLTIEQDPSGKLTLLQNLRSNRPGGGAMPRLALLPVGEAPPATHWPEPPVTVR